MFHFHQVKADDTPAIEVVLRADQERTRLLEEEKRLLAIVDNDDEYVEGIEDQLTELYDNLAVKNVGEQEGRARAILAGLGFDEAGQDRATKHFSGGWRMVSCLFSLQ